MTRWLVKAGILLGLVAAAALGFRWLDKPEGNSEAVFARIRVGMSQDEVVNVLRTFNASSGRTARGVTTDGSFWTNHLQHPAMDDLPRSEHVTSCELTALDSYGREIEVFLGPGGVVSQKRLSPGIWEHRWGKVWREVRDVPWYLGCASNRQIALAVATALTILAGLVLRRRIPPLRA